MMNVAEKAEVGLVVAKEQPDPVNELILRYYFAWLDWIVESRWAKTTNLTLEQWFLQRGL